MSAAKNCKCTDMPFVNWEHVTDIFYRYSQRTSLVSNCGYFSQFAGESYSSCWCIQWYCKMVVMEWLGYLPSSQEERSETCQVIDSRQLQLPAQCEQWIWNQHCCLEPDLNALHLPEELQSATEFRMPLFQNDAVTWSVPNSEDTI